jgi:putative endonuclease
MVKHFVYILYSKRDGKLYVGCTRDIKKRFNLHNSGQVKTTKYRQPLVLIHKEFFSDKAEAFSRERFLKSLWGARLKRKILNKYLKTC